MPVRENPSVFWAQRGYVNHATKSRLKCREMNVHRETTNELSKLLITLEVHTLQLVQSWSMCSKNSTKLQFVVRDGSEENVVQTTKQIHRVMRVIKTAYLLALNSHHQSLRAFYYANRDIFSSQTQSNKAIVFVSKMLRISRYKLGFVAASKCLVFGFSNPCGRQNVVHQIEESLLYAPPHIFEAQNARFIVLIEKESVFRRLHRKFNSLPC